MRYTILLGMLLLAAVVAVAPVYATSPTVAPGISMHERGYAEGYSHWPMSFPNNKTYVEDYNMGVRDYKYTFQDKAWVYLGNLPAHSNDGYKDWYRGSDDAGDYYWAIQGKNINSTNWDACPPGHSTEYCLGWKFGIGIPENFDAS